MLKTLMVYSVPITYPKIHVYWWSTLIPPIVRVVIGVCMCVEDGHGEYFDSLGMPPTANFEHYLNEHYWSWTFNRRQLQSDQ